MPPHEHRKVEPALTKKEWAERRIAPLSCDDVAIRDDGDGLEIVVYPDGSARDSRNGLLSKHKLAYWDTGALPALIALANAALPDSDPRKITREKIEHMKAIAESIRPTLSNESHIGFLDELAAALQSYLPPAG